MADRFKFRSLTVKLLGVMALALVLALLSFLAMILLGNTIVQQFYLSSDAINRRMDTEISAFRTFVEENSLPSTDVHAVGQWNREHPKITVATAPSSPPPLRARSWWATRPASWCAPRKSCG